MIMSYIYAGSSIASWNNEGNQIETSLYIAWKQNVKEYVHVLICAVCSTKIEI